MFDYYNTRIQRFMNLYRYYKTKLQVKAVSSQYFVYFYLLFLLTIFNIIYIKQPETQNTILVLGPIRTPPIFHHSSKIECQYPNQHP